MSNALDFLCAVQQESEEVKSWKSKGFTNEQAKALEKYSEEGLDITILENVNYCIKAMEEIVEGLRDGIDVSWYAKTDYTYLQMREIRRGLNKGIDAYWYAHKEFTPDNISYLVNRMESCSNDTNILRMFSEYYDYWYKLDYTRD